MLDAELYFSMWSSHCLFAYSVSHCGQASVKTEKASVTFGLDDMEHAWLYRQWHMKRKALSIYDLFKPLTENTQVSDVKKLRAIQGELPHFYKYFTFKKMKIVGDTASANEEAANPEQIAEDNHRNKK